MAGVYISYPFCAQKCSFCNFASGVYPKDLAKRYLAVLAAEIAAHRWEWLPETVYLGGGTPGSIDPDNLRTLLASVPGRPWKEATIEAAPGFVTTGQLRGWVEAGINRVSLGVQSFVSEELRGTGRRHDAQTVAREVRLLREGGIANFNVDLIAGLPGQTRAGWRESLEWVARLEAPHVSVYMLEVDEDSRLGREVLRGGQKYRAAEAPGEELTVEFYETAVEWLEREGLLRYEISNFARPGFESAHNLKYWRLEPYVGFGADAHSLDGRRRRQNAETPEEYVARAESGQPLSVAEWEAKPGEERFWVGLRLRDGVRLREGEAEALPAAVARLSAEGLLEVRGDRLRLTPKGVLFSNEVFQEFLDL